MKSSSMFAVPALAVVVAAQSGRWSPDFPVEVQTNLRVDYLRSSTSVSPAGILLPRDDVLDAPTVYGPANATQEATYMAFLVDEDVDTRSGPRVQLLHYFQPNLVGTNDILEIVNNAQNATTAVGAPYFPPTPPGGDIAHRYSMLLYAQPEDSTVPQAYSTFSPPANVSARYPFNMSGFADAAGLGQPVAANWFRVINATSTATGSPSAGTVSATANAAASASSSATGAASLVEVRGSVREMAIGLGMSIVGAWLWML